MGRPSEKNLFGIHKSVRNVGGAFWPKAEERKKSLGTPEPLANPGVPFFKVFTVYHGMRPDCRPPFGLALRPAFKSA